MRVSEELNTESQGRLRQAEMLADQVMRFEKEAADWRKKLADAISEGAARQRSR